MSIRKRSPRPSFLEGLVLPILHPGHRQRRDLVATFDHSDIRGLGTARLVFIAELPRSYFGSSAYALFARFFEGSPERGHVSGSGLDVFVLAGLVLLCKGWANLWDSSLQLKG